MQVGDVVLVQDESVMENEFKMVGLETLVCSLVSSPTQPHKMNISFVMIVYTLFSLFFGGWAAHEKRFGLNAYGLVVETFVQQTRGQM